MTSLALRHRATGRLVLTLEGSSESNSALGSSSVPTGGKKQLLRPGGADGGSESSMTTKRGRTSGGTKRIGLNVLCRGLCETFLEPREGSSRGIRERAPEGTERLKTRAGLEGLVRGERGSKQTQFCVIRSGWGVPSGAWQVKSIRAVGGCKPTLTTGADKKARC